MAKHAANFHEYIERFPSDTARRLKKVRDIILSVVPGAEESIRYGMPAFKVGSTHLYVAGYKHHIGMYPLYGVPELEKIIAAYRAPKTKDTIHFRHDQALPLDVIQAIAELKLKTSMSMGQRVTGESGRTPNRTM